MELIDRLELRREEIVETVLTRLGPGLDGDDADANGEYREGTSNAATVALDYALDAIFRGDDGPGPIPALLRERGGLASRCGLKLEEVLRRYSAGHAVVAEFLVEELADADVRVETASLRTSLRALARALDRLLDAIGSEYSREATSRLVSPEVRKARRVERLLAGDPVDLADLGYEIDGPHRGLIATGPGAGDAVSFLLSKLECRRLVVRRDAETTWIWLGGRDLPEIPRLQKIMEQGWPDKVSLAVGEPGAFAGGWRFTHRQARAALPIALGSDSRLTLYSEVAAIASAKQDDLLVASLRSLYIEPLRGAPDGVALRDTLRAYFSAGGNVSSAAATLAVGRRTVSNRIHVAEEYLGRTLEACAVDLQLALRLDELE